MIRFLLKVLTYPARRLRYRREWAARLRENANFKWEDHQNVRITKKIGDGEFVVIRDFD